MFDREWWEYCDAIDVPQNGRVVRGWDLAGTEAKKAKAIKASYTAGVRMRRVGSKYYIEHVKRFQASSFKVEQEMMRLAEADGRDVSIDIPQDPGQAGKSQKAYLGGKFPGFNVRFSPESGEKETRALGLSAQAEAGNVFLVRGEWNKAFVDEAAMFPKLHVQGSDRRRFKGFQPAHRAATAGRERAGDGVVPMIDDAQRDLAALANVQRGGCEQVL